MNYTQAQIDRANAVSLEDFLRTQGETLIKSGREYRWKEHDSLTVRGNKWFRHSQSKGGYPIDFVMEFYGKSFPEAVQLLTGESGEGQSEASTAPPTAFHLPLHNRTADRAINDKKVTDHHAVIPTRNLKDADLSALPAGEKAVLELVALRLLCAVAQPHIYSETVVIAACAGGEFTAKGKTVKHPGWKALEDAYRAKMKDAEPKKDGAEKALPELTEGQTLAVAAAIVKEGKSSPPQHFTEDTLLSAMETAGKEDTPAVRHRAGIPLA